MPSVLVRSNRCSSDGVLIKPPGLDALTERIIGCAIAVHRATGAGLLESVYKRCLAIELQVQGLSIQTNHPLPLVYRDIVMERAFWLDMVVEGIVIGELKEVEALAPVHQSQVLTYLKLANCPAGLLINFNVPVVTASAVSCTPTCTRDGKKLINLPCSRSPVEKI